MVHTQREQAVRKTPITNAPDVKNIYDALIADDVVRQALDFIKSDDANTLKDQIQITEIPAPPFMEQTRAEYYKGRLAELGLFDIKTDAEGNVFGIRPGTGEGPTLFVSAHLDTVFPEGTETTVSEKDGKYYAPGISDDGRGLAAVLSLVRTFQTSGIKTNGTIIFGGTVGEEGLGDLRGVKAFFKENKNIDGFISVEQGHPSGNIYLATGSHRYQITYKGPGGHSFIDFGTPNAVHAMGRAIAKIADLPVPTEPKTTYSVGVVNGGTSINAIAQKATMMLDIRSNSQEELLKLEKEIVAILNSAADEENDRWNRKDIEVEIQLVGDRPAGSQPTDAMIVQAAVASTTVLGFEPELEDASSTDANVPISLGIPALTLPGGGTCGGVHTLAEYFDPTDAYYGVQKVFLTILGLVGVEGISAPLLKRM